MLSKYEKDITIIKVDVLKRIAEYFNVTTDYLLGLSDMKRDLSGQIKMNETLDEYYDLIEVYCKLRSNGMPVPLLRNGYSIFNGTKYR